MTDRFGCPECGGEQNCPCEHCAKRNAGKVVWRWVDGDLIACGHCGLTAHEGQWLDWEVDWAKAHGKWPASKASEGTP